MKCSLALLAATFACGLAACGGGSSAGTDLSAVTVTTANGESNQAYLDCLTQNGVDAATASRLGGGQFGGVAPGGSGPVGSLPSGATRGSGSRLSDGSRPTDGSRLTDGSRPTDGSLGAPGTINEAMQQALNACQSLRPQGGGGGLNAPTANAIAPYLSCLADNGVVVPATTAPTAGGTAPPGLRSGGLAGIDGIDRTQPAFPAADAKCNVLLPAAVAGNGGPGATTSSPATSR
jgi:hypothetical protein